MWTLICAVAFLSSWTCGPGTVDQVVVGTQPSSGGDDASSGEGADTGDSDTRGISTGSQGDDGSHGSAVGGTGGSNTGDGDSVAPPAGYVPMFVAQGAMGRTVVSCAIGPSNFGNTTLRKPRGDSLFAS